MLYDDLNLGSWQFYAPIMKVALRPNLATPPLPNPIAGTVEYAAEQARGVESRLGQIGDTLQSLVFVGMDDWPGWYDEYILQKLAPYLNPTDETALLAHLDAIASVAPLLTEPAIDAPPADSPVRVAAEALAAFGQDMVSRWQQTWQENPQASNGLLDGQLENNTTAETYHFWVDFEVAKSYGPVVRGFEESLTLLNDVAICDTDIGREFLHGNRELNSLKRVKTENATEIRLQLSKEWTDYVSRQFKVTSKDYPDEDVYSFDGIYQIQPSVTQSSPLDLAFLLGRELEVVKKVPKWTVRERRTRREGAIDAVRIGDSPKRGKSNDNGKVAPNKEQLNTSNIRFRIFGNASEGSWTMVQIANFLEGIGSLPYGKNAENASSRQRAFAATCYRLDDGENLRLNDFLKMTREASGFHVSIDEKHLPDAADVWQRANSSTVMSFWIIDGKLIIIPDAEHGSYRGIARSLERGWGNAEARKSRVGSRLTLAVSQARYAASTHKGAAESSWYEFLERVNSRRRIHWK
ncbi:hypothetical protein ACFYPT_42120 [Streptomyces sp. NPDC005529]|uniref:hypothetical protein n=1 Tax=unclassified Streptomyces TaxID=2593676 RepID=UPI0033ABBD10